MDAGQLTKCSLLVRDYMSSLNRVKDPRFPFDFYRWKIRFGALERTRQRNATRRAS